MNSRITFYFEQREGGRQSRGWPYFAEPVFFGLLSTLCGKDFIITNIICQCKKYEISSKYTAHEETRGVKIILASEQHLYSIEQNLFRGHPVGFYCGWFSLPPKDILIAGACQVFM